MRMGEAELSALKARVDAYELDASGDAVPFSAKLQREAGWSAARTRRAIREYKRFVVLAAAAGHEVSPSPIVDQVWHLHLTYTRSYWDDFCPNVLGRPLHHEPSRGGRQEVERLAEAYERTLASYRRIFAEPRPTDIWPAPRSRAVSAAGRRPVGVLAAMAGPLLLVGCAVVDSAAPGGIPGRMFILWYAGAAVAVLMLKALLSRRAEAPRLAGPIEEAELDVYELAYLAGGASRVFATALLRLTREGYLVVSPGLKSGASKGAVRKALLPGAPLPRDGSRIDEMIVDAVRRGRLTGARVIAEPVAELKRRLQGAGLIRSRKARRPGGIIVRGLVLALLVVGLVRLYFGLLHHRPVAFLIIALVLVAIYGLLPSRAEDDSRTALGRIRLADARAAKLLPKARALAPEEPNPVLAFAIWGLDAVWAADFADFRHMARGFGVATTDVRAGSKFGSGDGGCSGGGGGGCGGGGCGGCGG